MSLSAEPEALAAARERMITDQLAARGMRDERVLEAFRRVPRERFLSPGAWRRAYDDSALPIDCEQTISQPYMVAHMTAALELRGDERVLEIGTGSGYQTAILALLARWVYTIERHDTLLTAAQQRLSALNLQNITCRSGDGTTGWAAHAPYDAILVTAGAPAVPEALTDELAEGGRLVIPVGTETDQTLRKITRTGGELREQRDIACRFVKLVGRSGWQVAGQ